MPGAEHVAPFSSYLVARRAEYLWRKFEAGDLAAPPVGFSHGDAMTALARAMRGRSADDPATSALNEVTSTLRSVTV